MSTTYRFDHAWLGGHDLADDVAIGIDGDRIASVEQGVDRGTSVPGIALPGMVSAHSHAFHRALRGRTHAAGGDFWAWRDAMYQLANDLNPESYQTLATAVFTEMLRSGITSVGEFHYLHRQPDGRPYDEPNAMGNALIAAARTTGIRLTLIDTLYLTGDVDGTPLSAGQARFTDGSADSWSERVRYLKSSDLAKIGVAAHSVRAVPTGDLGQVASLAKELDGPVHVHVSEQPGENEACVREHGVTPIQLLVDHGLVDQRTTLVHATHTTDADQLAVASNGAGVCFCPTTEADLGDGIGPAYEYSGLGVRLSLGSDSNAIIDPFEEMRRVEHHDRLRIGRRGLHSPSELLDMATSNGARSLGWDAGRLKVGALADIAVVDPEHLDLAGFDPTHGLGSIVMAATRAAVSHVFVGGKMVHSPGRPIPTIDLR